MARAITVDLSTGKAQLVHRATRPHPGPGQVLVRMLVRPVHPLDVIFIKNPSVIPEILNSHGKTLISGCEGFGCVEEIGEGITHFKPGQRVVPLQLRGGPQYGTWQDYMVVDEKKVIAVPDSVSDETAAQFIVNPWTVYGLVETLAVPKGEYIIQTAAGSALGRQLIQLAKHQGIKTINIVRRDEWKHELKALGADEVINSKTEDVVARVKEITGGKLAYGAVDAVGGILTKSVGASVRDDGKVLVYANLSGEDYMQSILDLRRGVEFKWWRLYKHVASEEKERQFAAEVMKLLEEKIITPLAGKKFKLEDFKEAIEESEKEGRSGKVLLVS